MEHFEQIVKALSVLLGTLAPLLKLFGHMAKSGSHRQDRPARLKAYSDDWAICGAGRRFDTERR